MANVKWKLEGYDSFAHEYYPIDGDYHTEAEALSAAQVCLAELERTQPSASSGGQDGIQDHIYVVRPNNTVFRIKHLLSP